MPDAPTQEQPAPRYLAGADMIAWCTNYPVSAAVEIERLRAGIEAIRQATLAGKVCDDVAWFDEITTLHDYCELLLEP